jgi:hypothetical protein
MIYGVLFMCVDKLAIHKNMTQKRENASPFTTFSSGPERPKGVEDFRVGLLLRYGLSAVEGA